jgi:O-antigen ligase
MPRVDVKSGAERLGRWSSIALGVSIPISTAIDNLLLLVVFACFALSGRLGQARAIIKHNPVIIAALALFGLMAIGTLYGDSSSQDSLSYLSKYIDLLFAAVFAVFFREPATRRTALYALASAIAATVLLSFALAMGLLPNSQAFINNIRYAVPFKHSLTHGVLVGFGAFLFIQLAAFSSSRTMRWTWISLAALATANILFVVPARTGIVLIGGLAVYCGYLRWSSKGVAAILSVSVLFLILAYSSSSLLQQQIDQAISELASWKSNEAAGAANSIGTRLEFYSNTLAIVRDQPLFGVGTGGFPQAYAERITGTAMQATRNPHNEYMLVMAQLGLVGLGFLLHLFYQQWRLAPGLPTALEANLGRGMVIAIALGCLFNSLLLDHTEGLLFAWLTGLLFGGLNPTSDNTLRGGYGPARYSAPKEHAGRGASHRSSSPSAGEKVAPAR